MVSVLDSRPSGQGLALAGDIVLCSWTRHFTLKGLLSTHVCKFNAGTTLQWTSILSRGE